jgi:7,8-dihydropterin-6-yl-methyl-4-(beta-D-ribofuranosyl)aminobenzene 5'-phosphate synthase
VAHPLAINPKFSLNPSLKFIGSNLDQTSVNAAGGILLLVRNPVRVASGVMTTGEVPRETGFEKGETFWTVQDERFVEDPIIDDQALLINVKDKGLVVITGCAHSGIINTLRLAKKTSGISHVCAIVGGFHLARADNNRIQATLDELLSIGPKSIHPCHCTGPKATRRFMDSFVGNCRPIQTGDIIAL